MEKPLLPVKRIYFSITELPANVKRRKLRTKQKT